MVARSLVLADPQVSLTSRIELQENLPRKNLDCAVCAQLKFMGVQRFQEPVGAEMPSFA
jgi:hypothetical protein